MPSAASPDVAFALLGDVTASSRALRQIRSLAASGARVHALSVGVPRDPDALPSGAALQIVPVPGARGPALFWAAHRAMRAAAFASGARVLHASDLHVLPALAQVARGSGARLVYDAREYYPGLDAARRPWVRWTWGAIERRFAPLADATFTVNDAIADTLAARYRMPRPTVVRNVSDAPASGLPRTGDLRQRLGLSDTRPLVLYQGLWRDGRGLLELTDAMRAVPGAALVLIGEGPLAPALESRAADARGSVFLLPFTPPDALVRLTPDADLGAMTALPLTESLRMALPNKLFEYAAAGVPTLAGSGIEPLAELVTRYDAGLSVDPTDPDALARAIRQLLAPEARERHGSGARRLHAAHTWEAESATFLEAYSEWM